MLIIKNEAYWYLALNELAQGEAENVKNYLQQIGQGSSRYTSAQALLKKL